MKAIVHIGTEKTGTTSIQKFLYLNRRKLKKAGFHFLQSAGKTNNRALPAYCVADDRFDDYFRSEGILTPEDKEAFKIKFVQDFSAEIASLPSTIHTVIISSEHFHSRIRTDEDMQNVHAFLTPYFSEFRILCYLRDQVSTCTSYYSTALKSGNTNSFTDFFERCKPENYYFNYLEMLENWEKYFGIDALEVSLFSRDRFLNGDLLDDFTAKLDAELLGILDKTVEIENESLTPTGQALARAVNMAFPIRTARIELGDLRELCKSQIYQRYKGAGRQPSLAAQEKVFSDFLEVNEALRKKFFPQLDSLFAPPSGKVTTFAGIDTEFIEGLNKILDTIKVSGKSVIRPEEYSQVFRSIAASVTDITYVEGEQRKEGREAIISGEDLRLLRQIAFKIDSQDLVSATKLLTLVNEIDPGMQGVAQKLEDYSKRSAKPLPYMYIIKYAADLTNLDEEVQSREMKRFADWLSEHTDYIVGSTVNALAQTYSITAEKRGPKPTGSITTGFTILRADSFETARSIAQKCPHLDIGGSIEVSQILQLTPAG